VLLTPERLRQRHSGTPSQPLSGGHTDRQTLKLRCCDECSRAAASNLLPTPNRILLELFRYRSVKVSKLRPIRTQFDRLGSEQIAASREQIRALGVASQYPQCGMRVSYRIFTVWRISYLSNCAIDKISWHRLARSRGIASKA